MVNTIIRWLEKPYRFEILDKYLRGAGARVLDVGCGNHSASRTKKYYPSCKYYGVDVTRYNNDEQDFQCMEQYFEMNIDEPQNLAPLPNLPAPSLPAGRGDNASQKKSQCHFGSPYSSSIVMWKQPQ